MPDLREMTQKKTSDAATASDPITEGIQAQIAGLDLLLAEIKALAAVLPVALPHDPPSDAEIEADHDNMPV